MSTQDCVETGYFYYTVNAFSAQGIGQTIRTLAHSPGSPLLVYDTPLAQQIHGNETQPSVLHVLELSPWSPGPRNVPFSCHKLISFIETNYTPDLAPMGRFRVWHPKPAQHESKSPTQAQ